MLLPSMLGSSFKPGQASEGGRPHAQNLGLRLGSRSVTSISLI